MTDDPCRLFPHKLYEVLLTYFGLLISDLSEALIKHNNQLLTAMDKIKIKLSADDVILEGDLTIPLQSGNLVIFITGFDGRSDKRNRFIAEELHKEGFATLLFDFLNKKEMKNWNTTDTDLLMRRVLVLTSWINNHTKYHRFKIAYLGLISGAVPALKAAAKAGSQVKAVVSVSGHTDLVENVLPYITCPTLLVAAEYDFHILKLNKKALTLIRASKNMVVIPGASHLFEEPDKMKKVARISAAWYRKYLPDPKLLAQTPKSLISSNK